MVWTVGISGVMSLLHASYLFVFRLASVGYERWKVENLLFLVVCEMPYNIFANSVVPEVKIPFIFPVEILINSLKGPMTCQPTSLPSGL